MSNRGRTTESEDSSVETKYFDGSHLSDDTRHWPLFFADIDLIQHVYTCTRLGVLEDLCSDIILDHDFQKEKEHERVTIEFGGNKPELIIPNSAPVCAVCAATIDEIYLFSNLLPNLSPLNPGVSARMTRISFNKRFLSFSPMVLLRSVHRLYVHKWL